MEKNRINRFVQKYNLGLIESVKWDVEGTTLSTSFISDDKSVLGTKQQQISILITEVMEYMILPNSQKCYLY